MIIINTLLSIVGVIVVLWLTTVAMKEEKVVWPFIPLFILACASTARTALYFYALPITEAYFFFVFVYIVCLILLLKIMIGRVNK